MGQGNDEVAGSPAQIREAIAQARADLGEHLSALGNPPPSSGPDGPGEKTMPTPTKRSEAKGEKSSPKAAKAKTTPGPKKKVSTTKMVKGVAAKAGEVIDTMAAGAVAGAITAAAQSISEGKAKALKGRRKAAISTREVLAEIAPDAAMGAVVGAAKAVMPAEANPLKPKGSKPKTVKK